MAKSAGEQATKIPAQAASRSESTGSRLVRPGWIAATIAFASLAFSALPGCSGADAASESTSDTGVAAALGGSSDGVHTDIFGGLPDTEQLSGVVALRIGTRAPFEICSGALVAPNVVLTARHCVSRMVAQSVVCTDRGESANGPHVAEDHAADEMSVYTSPQPDFHAAPDARVTAVVHPAGASLCNADVALVVLDRAPSGATPLPVRFGKGVQANEGIRAVGYGKPDSVSDPGTRMRKDGVAILEVGAKLTRSDTALGNHEFEVGRSICQGDSGGPSISESTGAVVGVVSRGADCRQDFGHVYTQTAGFEALFAEALLRAGQTLRAEDGRTLSADDLLAASATNEAAVTSGPSGSGGCSTSGQAGGRGTGSLALAAAAAASVLARRRRRAGR